MKYQRKCMVYILKGGRRDMIICKDCNIPMQPIMSFSKDKQEKYNKCPRCYGETKHVKLRDDELTFGELLHKELKK